MHGSGIEFYVRGLIPAMLYLDVQRTALNEYAQALSSRSRVLMYLYLLSPGHRLNFICQVV